MNCRAFHELLQRRLDGTPVADSAYETHRRGCAECAGLHAAALKLLEGLRLVTPPAPPAGLEDRLTAALLRRQRRFFRGRRVAIPLAIAACLLIAIGARLFWGKTSLAPGPTTGDGIVKKDTPPVSEPRGLLESVTEAGEAVVALTGRAADDAVDSTRWLLPRVKPPVVAPPPTPALPVGSLEAAGAGVRDGLAPVAHSARRAVDRFFRELPVDFSDGRGL
jgi:hypothetical protein